MASLWKVISHPYLSSNFTISKKLKQIFSNTSLTNIELKINQNRQIWKSMKTKDNTSTSNSSYYGFIRWTLQKSCRLCNNKIYSYEEISTTFSLPNFITWCYRQYFGGWGIRKLGCHSRTRIPKFGRIVATLLFVKN